MARCPKLDCVNSGFFSGKTYQCELTGLEMHEDDPKCKFVCNADSGYEYEKCPVYQNR